MFEIGDKEKSETGGEENLNPKKLKKFWRFFLFPWQGRDEIPDI